MKRRSARIRSCARARRRCRRPPQPRRARPRPRPRRWGGFELQRCADCGAVQYPPREACVTLPVGTNCEWTPDERRGRAGQRDDAASQQRTVLPRARCRGGSGWCGSTRADSGRASRRALRRGARRACTVEARARPRRPGGAGRQFPTGSDTHGRRPEAARDDLATRSSARCWSPTARPRSGQALVKALVEGRRRDRLGRPCRALEEAAGLRRIAGIAAGRRWCRSTSPTTDRSTSSPARSAARSTS